MSDLPLARRIYSIKGTWTEVRWAADRKVTSFIDAPLGYRMFALDNCPLASLNIITACHSLFDDNDDQDSFVFTNAPRGNCYDLVGFFVSPFTDYSDIFSILVEHYREHDLLPSHAITGEELYSRHPEWLARYLKDNHNVIIAFGNAWRS